MKDLIQHLVDINIVFIEDDIRLLVKYFPV